MDAPKFNFATEREGAAKIGHAAKAAGIRLFPLPYSRFDPDRSTWWLSPSSDNPSYAVGKVVVERPTVSDDGAKFIGLHIEKGVGPNAAPFFGDSARARRLIMNRDWTWHAFARSLQDGGLEPQLAEAEIAADGLPLAIEVVASVQSLPNLDGADERCVNPESVDRLRYHYSGSTLTQVAGEGRNKLVAMSTSETLNSIGAKVAAIQDADWTWLEILVGVPFRPVAEGGLPATDLWRRVCAPWVRWIR